MANSVVRIGGRVVAGVVAVGAAAAIVGAATLLPLPDQTSAAGATGLTVTPAAVEQQRSCPGPLLRLGDVGGADATAVTSFGVPALTATAGSVGTPLADVDVVAGAGAASLGITAPPVDEIGALAAAQSQVAAEPDQAGLAVAACSESSAASWLLGGATDVGRTTLLVLTNSSPVESTVDVRLFTGEGEVEAPGLTDLVVAPASQRVLSLAGFAPGSAGIAVRVESRGGLIVPTLDQSIVRGLEPGGVELTGATEPPALEQIIPGVRITTAADAASRAQVGGSADVGTVLRVLVPGDDDAQITVGAASDSPGVSGTSLDARATAGRVVDIPIEGLGDGTFTVTVQSDVPVVAALRAATVGAPDPNADIADSEVSYEITGDDAGVTVVAGQRIDFAWFVAAPVLNGSVALAVAQAPAPRLTLTARADAVVSLSAPGGAPQLIDLPAGSTSSIDLQPGVVYTLDETDGVIGGVSYAEVGQLAAAPVRPASPLASAITVYR